MAGEQNENFALKLLVDNEENRVIVAVANREFIDTLFSFLTLPLGTIIRLVFEEQQQDQLAEVVCINNLYDSVKDFSDEVFWNPICKRMLLHPRNPCESICQKLKLNVDNTKPSTYFMCSTSCGVGLERCLSTFEGASCCSCGVKLLAKPSRYFMCRSSYEVRSQRFLSAFEGASCCSCGKLMNKEVKLLEDPREEPHGDGAFVKGEDKYLVFDDLKVLQISPSNFARELAQYGYRDFSKLRESQRNVGKKEILNLLKQALISKSPLSDVLLENRESNRMDTSLSRTGVPRSCYSCNTNIRLKVIVRKSNNEVLWAEAEEDFIDFLLSFLTTPLGSILMLLDGNFSVGCMHNLYNSVKKLDSSCLVRSFGTSLLNPKVAPQFGFSRGPIQLNEQATPTYRYGKRVMKKNICCGDGNGVISKNSCLVKNSCPMKLFDPRSPDGKSDVGFVRRPSRFVVRDYLKVSSLANTPIISLVQEFNIPLDDFKVQEVGIGKTEALKLLGASLTSKTALTDALSDLFEEGRQMLALKHSLVGVDDIVRQHWATYGRHYYTRYDYENVDASSAKELMAYLVKLQSSLSEVNQIVKGVRSDVSNVVHPDEFEYKDPVDGSVSSHQSIRYLFEDGSRLIFRLSGTGSEGATIRLYIEQYEKDPSKIGRLSQEALAPLVEVALKLSKMQEFTGRSAPTVIT